VLSSGRFVFQGTPAELAKETPILDQHLGISATKMI
jgi:ABC-type branched-subunit amino acid transport system ATPase component